MKRTIILVVLLAIMSITLMLSCTEGRTDYSKNKKKVDSADRAASRRLSDQAEELIHAEKLGEARQLIRKALEINTGNSAAYNDWAAINQLQKLPSDSIVFYYKMAIKAGPENAAPYLNLARYSLDAKQYKQAIISLDNLLASPAAVEYLTTSQNAILYQILGSAKIELEDYEGAIVNLKKALEFAPSNENAHGNLGTAYMELKDYEKAIEECNIAININPKLAFAYNCRGICYYNTDQFQKALQDYDYAIEIKPDSKYYYYDRGLLYKDMKMKKKALNDFRKSYSLGDIESKKYIEELEA